MGEYLNPYKLQQQGALTQIGAQKQQMQMAQDQWDWQKKMYKEQMEAAKALSGTMTSLVGQYNTAYGDAKAANEARYKQLLNIADTTTGQRMADVRSAYGQQQADAMQNLARLGMSNTTIAPTMQMGIQREQQSALNRVADELQGTKLGIIERRTDEYPNANLLMALATMFGQGGGMSGMGSGTINSFGGLKL